MDIVLKTLTPLWTGGTDQTTDRLHETGLIGSLRWWYEAIVRGLGGYACDPTSDDRCPDKDGNHCAACELFGCTGWARKFRLQILTTPLIENKAIAARQSLEITIIPLRNIEAEEWYLLNATFRLISEYGAIGGKTIFKPSDEQNRQHEFHHLDFGLVTIQLPDENLYPATDLEKIREYVISKQWRSGTHKYRDKEGKEHDYSWVSLQNYWFVKKWYLARRDENVSTFNQVIGRKQPKHQAQQLVQNNSIDKWLAGSQQESKKVFSFRNPARTFGFVNPSLIDFAEMKERLNQVWSDFDSNKEFITGEQILKDIFKARGGAA